jgi:hypothetical protein
MCASPAWAGVAAPPVCSLSPLENVIRYSLRLGLCDSDNSGYALVDLPTTNPPTFACVDATGTNKSFPVLDFNQTTDNRFDYTMQLPSDWVGPIDVDYVWYSGTGSTNPVTWCAQIICAGDGDTPDVARPAQSTTNCVSDAGKASASPLQLNAASDTNVTTSGGCAAGDLMHLTISRDPDETSTLTDTHAADARLVAVTLTLRRSE